LSKCREDSDEEKELNFTAVNIGAVVSERTPELWRRLPTGQYVIQTP